MVVIVVIIVPHASIPTTQREAKCLRESSPHCRSAEWRGVLQLKGFQSDTFFLVAEWIHFTLLGIILPTIKLKVYTFGGAYELSNYVLHHYSICHGKTKNASC